MNCVILQPSYIPWRGYFHQIQKADVFVFYDDVQYDAHGWRNRNRIKAPGQVRWLTIPVHLDDHCANATPICRVTTCCNVPWNKKHFETLRHSYGKAPYFQSYEPLLRSWYSTERHSLADFTIAQTIELARDLGLKASFYRSSELGLSGGKTERLVRILEHFGAKRYISGPSAAEYLDRQQFEDARIELEFMSYAYPEYQQLHGAFDPHVSVLDLLFMTGPGAPRYIWECVQ